MVVIWMQLLKLLNEITFTIDVYGPFVGVLGYYFSVSLFHRAF